MFDSHIHTKFSTDSNMTLEEALLKGKEYNIGLVITEHMDTNHPGEGKFKFNIEDYFEEYGKYRNNNLLLGIELGMSRDFKEINREIIMNNPFDQVIGSLHFLGNKDIFEKSTYENREKNEVYKEYLESLLENIMNHTYIDILAHIDYICRYGPFEDKELYYDEHSDIIDEIIKSCINNNIVMEINTRRFGLKAVKNNLFPIYKRYKELGGKNISIGSDAHVKEHIGNNFSLATEISTSLDLKVVYFKDRKMNYL